MLTNNNNLPAFLVAACVDEKQVTTPIGPMTTHAWLIWNALSTPAHSHATETCSPHQSADSGVSWEGCACGEVRRLVNGVVDSDGWHNCSICSRYLETGMS